MGGKGRSQGPTKTRVLCVWLGHGDRRAAAEGLQEGRIGATAKAVVAAEDAGKAYDRVLLLDDGDETEGRTYETWLAGFTQASVTRLQVALPQGKGHAQIGQVVNQTRAALKRFLDVQGLARPDSRLLSFHLSPGTPAMGLAWYILAQSDYPARLLEADPKKQLVHDMEPDPSFRLQALEVPEAAGLDQLRSKGPGRVKAAPAGFVAECDAMQEVLHRARSAAALDAPVYLLGNTGTGKTRVADLIHSWSSRCRGPFRPVNCASIVPETAESQLFGHVPGAFTGAVKFHAGFFEQAHGGTIFLDEFDCLPLSLQAKLLKVVEDGEVWPMGAELDTKKGTFPKRVDVRLICATARDPRDLVSRGELRKDLFYRIFVLPIQIPDLKDRGEDLQAILRGLFDAATATLEQPLKLSDAAFRELCSHPWPGNVRELDAVLRRAVAFCEGNTVTLEDVKSSLAWSAHGEDSTLLDFVPSDEVLPIEEARRRFEAAYFRHAYRVAGNVGVRAAKLLGIKPSTFSGKKKEHGF